MSIKLIVGLGNPGDRYSKTRHNAGFWFLDRLAADNAASFRQENRFHGEIARLGDCWLLKPATFMNHSGQSVIALSQYYKLSPEQLLVVYDDLDLPCGTARLKQGGGHGGHNGLKDIMAHLSSQAFHRLRLGIGRPPAGDEVINYVLNAPSREQQAAIDNAVSEALGTLPLVLDGNIGKAMQQLHTKPATAKPS